MLSVNQPEDSQKSKMTEFLTLLPRALQAIECMHAAPHDDTIMHRFLDTFCQHVLSMDDANNGGVFPFFDNVLRKLNEVIVQVVVLSLGMASHVLTKVCPPEKQQKGILQLFDAIKTDSHIEDSSIGAAFFNSLTKLAQLGILLEFCNNHLHTALDTLEHGQSIFLRKAAENFVAATFAANLKKDIATESSARESTTSSLATVPTPVAAALEICNSALEEMSQKQSRFLVSPPHANTFHQSVVHVVSLLSASEEFCEWKKQDTILLVTLLHLAQRHPSQMTRLSALSAVVNISSQMAQEAKEHFLMKEVVPIVLKLGLDGEIEKAVDIANSFLKDCWNSRDCSEATTVLLRFYQLPCDVLFGQVVDDVQLAALVPIIAIVLADTRHFGQLFKHILHSVKITNYCDGFIRLLESASSSRNDSNWYSLKSSWPTGAGDVVACNQKVLLSLLYVLEHDELAGLNSEQCSAILTCFLHVMKRPLVESQVYSQICATFLTVLDKLCGCLTLDERQEPPKVIYETVEVLQQRLVAVQWEVRDTTLEFLRKLTATKNLDCWLLRVVADSHLLSSAWSCVRDGESYARASAILLAAGLTTSEQWWMLFLQDCNLSKENLVSQVVEILSSDSEAFPRRAAVELLSVLFSTLASTSDTHPLRLKICTAMGSATSDFDWEVKLKVLDFWEGLATPLLAADDGDFEKVGSNHLQCNLTSIGLDSLADRECTAACKHEHGNIMEEKRCSVLQDLLRLGFGKALLAGVEDYDSAVKQKALNILSGLLEKCNLHTPSPRKIKKKECGLDSQVETVASVEKSMLKKSEMCADSKSFLRWVLELDPSCQMQQLGTSCDEYDLKPLSLLEDVMVAAASAATEHKVMLLSEDEFEDADDIFVDCY